jgi:hypothetical protein
MNSDLKFELKLKQLEDAIERLEKFKARGWEIQVKSTQIQIDKLSKELDEWDQ